MVSLKYFDFGKCDLHYLLGRKNHAAGFLMTLKSSSSSRQITGFLICLISSHKATHKFFRHLKKLLRSPIKRKDNCNWFHAVPS